MVLLEKPNPLKRFKRCSRVEGLVMLTPQNRSTGLEGKQGKGRSPRAGPYLREARRTEELFEPLPQV